MAGIDCVAPAIFPVVAPQQEELGQTFILVAPPQLSLDGTGGGGALHPPETLL